MLGQFKTLDEDRSDFFSPENFEPVTLAGVGAVMGGVGGLMSALGGGSGPSMMDPKIQGQQGFENLDIARYNANLGGANQAFLQDLSKYPLEVQQALLDQYTKTYGPIENQAAQFAQSAFAGEDAPYLQNQMSAFGAQIGGQRGNEEDRVNQMIAQMGIDPSSPYAAALRQQAQDSLTSNYNQGVANMRNQSAFANIGMAKDILGMGMQSPRLAGATLPNTPNTEAEKKASQDAQRSAASNVGSALSGSKNAWGKAAGDILSNLVNRSRNDFSTPTVSSKPRIIDPVMVNKQDMYSQPTSRVFNPKTGTYNYVAGQKGGFDPSTGRYT